MALGKLFRNLFIPQKNLPQFSPQAYRADMQAIENWANQISPNILFGVQVGAQPPVNFQSNIQLISVQATPISGYATIPFGENYKYGYTALVCSGDDLSADTCAVSNTSNLGALVVYLAHGGTPTSGIVCTVVYLICGA